MGIVSALEKIVGAKRVATSEAICLAYAFNPALGKDWVPKPDIVVMPETPEQISDILKEANRFKVPVTPKGSVGLAGHGGPLYGGILLDLTLMDKIILIDPVGMKAVTEAGCSFFKLSQELFKRDMMLPTAEYGPGPNVAASALVLSGSVRQDHGSGAKVRDLGLSEVDPNDILSPGTFGTEVANKWPT